MIDSRYYFGEPVAGAKVKYAVYRSRYWFPLWYEPDEDSPTDAGDAERQRLRRRADRRAAKASWMPTAS